METGQKVKYMRRGICFILLIAIIIVVAIDFQSKSANERVNKIAYDTIKAKNPGNITPACLPILNKYYKRFGVVISNYYQVTDCLAINLNNDKYLDTMVVLSPLSLEPVDEQCDFAFDPHPKRLLVEILNNNGKSKIRRIHSNLISDIGGVLSHYSGIFKTKNGFKIVHEAGAKYSWTYSVEFSIKKDSLALSSIYKKCSLNGSGKSVTYHYNYKSVDKINIPDTLSRQCNCDAIWPKLKK